MYFDTTNGGSDEEKARRELVQSIIDRMLYCKGFTEKCEQLVKENPLPETIKLNHSPLEFKQDN